jgi:putative ABC transport system permease protein
MESLAADVRQSFRMMRNSPTFTAIAVTALALGIGANTGIFSVVDKVLLQPLPYPEPDRLMRIGRKYPQGEGYANSIPKYMAWRHNNVFSLMALYDQQGPGLNLSSGDKPEQVKGVHVSGDYFKVFGTSPVLGRSLPLPRIRRTGRRPRLLARRFGSLTLEASHEFLERQLS